NTCMSLTLVYTNPDMLVGAHFSCPAQGMTCVAPKVLLDKMKTKIPALGKLKHIYFMGAWGVWSASYAKPILDFLEDLDDEYWAKFTQYDTADWKSVNITFKTDGSIEIVPTASGKTGGNASSKPTKWN